MNKYELIAQINEILEECPVDELELVLIFAEGYHRKHSALPASVGEVAH